MFYENELRFLCDSLKKMHLRFSFVSHGDPISEVLGNDLSFLFMKDPSSSDDTAELLAEIEPCTIYKYTFKQRFFFLLLQLPKAEKDSYFIIGPYLSGHISRTQVLEICELLGNAPKEQGMIEEIVASIPILRDDSIFFALMDAFGERIWGSGTSFKLIDLDRERKAPVFQLGNTKNPEDPDVVLLNMQMMEKRYLYENEILEAVKHGQIRKLSMLTSSFSEMSFERRVADPLRNAKNYAIIMNTLLRKAAEQGGVHPLYLDSHSSEYATKIEQLSSQSDVRNLMADMFSSYCRLVRKHSMKIYSPIVQKAILIIEADLSANLSLSSLAEAQKVSPGYLSTVFKRETGTTITDYIIDKRIKLASQLLTSTHLQVQSIALHCGIMDVQYFSKVFKKRTGKTPKEYREANK